MKKIIISGGPSTGKSTIFQTLKEKYPDAYFVDEAAEIVIKNELKKQKLDSNYHPILPLTDYMKFAPLVLAQQIADEANIPKTADLVFLDRSFLDQLGYLYQNGITKFNNVINQQVKKANYSLVFFCDWLNKFVQNEIRRETFEQGHAIHNHLEKVYNSSDIPIVRLQAVSVESRLDIINTTLESI